jgi:hypothetical protein
MDELSMECTPLAVFFFLALYNTHTAIPKIGAPKYRYRSRLVVLHECDDADDL